MHGTDIALLQEIHLRHNQAGGTWIETKGHLVLLGKKKKSDLASAIVIHRKLRKKLVAKDTAREDPMAILAFAPRRLGLSSVHMPANSSNADIAKMADLYHAQSKTLKKNTNIAG